VQEFLSGEVKRLAYRAASLWYRRDVVPSVVAADNVEERLQRYLEDLGGPPPGVRRAGAETSELLQQARLAQETLCAGVRRRYRDQGQLLPIDRLVRAFHLDLFEEEVILLALAQVADPRLGWLVSAFRGHEELTAPTIGLALSLFASEQERVSGLAAFLPAGRLRGGGLLLLGSTLLTGHRQFVPFQERELHLPDPVLSFLLGSAEFLPELSSVVRLLPEPLRPLAELVLPEPTRTAAREELLPGLGRAVGAEERAVVLLVGEEGSGRRAMAAALAEGSGEQGLAVVEVGSLADGGRPSPETLAVLFSAARLHGVALFFEHLEELWDGSPAPERELSWFVERLRSFGGRAYLGVTRPLPLTPVQLGCPVLTLRLTRPTVGLRQEIWTRALPEAVRPSAEELSRVAHRFRFGAADILAVAARLLERPLTTAPGGQQGPRLTEQRLVEGCELLQGARLRQFGERIQTGMTWQDLILDPELAQQFEEVKRYARYREILFSDWGFERRYSRGRGLSVLLAGPPGTGKTQSAELLAQELQLPIYRVDVSRLVDKYVGETEKHVAELFDRAGSSGSILLFDEADSLFGKRVEVRSSTDRYANQSVNFLLQKIEEYQGMVLLTSNMGQDIDPAFKRRLTFILEFKEPTDKQRALIWRSSVPAEAPLGANLDWSRLGRQYELTGGHIKNAVMRAALRAAQEGTKITMRLLENEAKRELQSRGRLVREE
jgi:SpoVK/Ycf46/Vps4 family AAA+-type ATPase